MLCHHQELFTIVNDILGKILNSFHSRIHKLLAKCKVKNNEFINNNNINIIYDVHFNQHRRGLDL